MHASKWAWFDGKIVPRETGAPSVASINFHLGTSVFDGFMAYWNEDHYYIHYGRAHLERFRIGAERMGLVIPWSVDVMIEGVNELLQLEPQATQYVRPIAYRRDPELWVTGAEGRPVNVSIFTVPSKRDVNDLISCHVSDVERISSLSIPGKTKVSGAYVNSFTARRQAELAGFDDAIMLDRHGRITEASAANLFFIEGDRLIAPADNEDIFPGITKEIVSLLADRLDIERVEEDIRLSDLYRFGGIFLCSTLMELRGFSKIGERTLKTDEMTVFSRLVDEFRRITHQ